ncbi:hypothetical protein, partial [Escherichia coli]|uniref:hypothetical protein n=1 Tax=Escherichia coli TaxID=562 RepID=UPI00197E1CC5
PALGRAREYPAFQSWDGIRGEPLHRVLTALSPAGRCSGSTAYRFFTSPNELLGGLTPIEALHGRLTRDRALHTAATMLLEMPSEERLDHVLAVASAEAAADDGQ